MVRTPIRSLAPAFGAALVTVAGAASGAAVYDLADDFSLVSNPNGVWSYNQANSPLTHLVANWGGIGGESFWTTTDTAIFPPAWTKTVAAKPGTHDWAVGDVVVHSSNSSNANAGNVTWTAPAAGLLNIFGSAWEADIAAGRDANWTISLNGVALASHTGIDGVLRGDADAQFSNNILPAKSLTGHVVAAGDVVRFQVDTTTTFGHFVGIDLQIELLDIPAPGALAAFGVVGAIGPRRRRA
jgi:hypothetical protein